MSDCEMECAICMADLDNVKHTITCNSCDESFCRSCVRRYNISIVELPNCPSCKVKWSGEFFQKSVLKSFFNGDYKNHRKKILFEHEQSKIPASMPHVEQFLKEREIKERMNILKKEIKEYQLQTEYDACKIFKLLFINAEKSNIDEILKANNLNWLSSRLKGNPKLRLDKLKLPTVNGYGWVGNRYLMSLKEKYKTDKLDSISEGFKKVENALSKLDCKVWNKTKLNDILNEFYFTSEYSKKNIGYGTFKGFLKRTCTYFTSLKNDMLDCKPHYLKLVKKITKERNELYKVKNVEKKEKKEKKKFMQRCGDGNCRGFLSQGWKCGVCSKKTCSKCFDLIHENEEHICDEDKVKTANLIKKETKNCPSCATAIYKISGCDQMWCTNCHVAFSWKTGLKVSGNIHNPHYFQWKRENGGRIRQPREVVCGGLPHEYSFVNYVRNCCRRGLIQEQHVNQLLELYRGTNHISHVILNKLRLKITNSQNDMNLDLRINYAIKEITEKQLKSTLLRRDRAVNKTTSILHIYELINTVFIECLNDLYQTILNMRYGHPNDESKLILSTKIEQTFDKCNKIREYALTQLKKVSLEFNQMVPVLNKDFTTRNIKLK